METLAGAPAAEVTANEERNKTMSDNNENKQASPSPVPPTPAAENPPINWEREVLEKLVFATLKERGYKGWISLEAFDFTPGAERIANESLHYLESEIAKLNL